MQSAWQLPALSCMPCMSCIKQRAAQATLQALETRLACAQVSAFCISQPAPKHLVRFCFCKEDAKLEEAVRRLRAYLGKQNLSNGHLLQNGNSKQ